jgi:hypothetical protein
MPAPVRPPYELREPVPPRLSAQLNRLTGASRDVVPIDGNISAPRSAANAQSVRRKAKRSA